MTGHSSSINSSPILRLGKNAMAGMLMAAISLALSANADARSEYWQQKVTLFNILPIEEGDIVFLGNSITDGGEFAELFHNPKIKNRGINSDVISGVRERLYQVTDHNPSKIFLLIGINDISHGHSVEKLAADYETLVKEIRQQSPKSVLYVQSIMPINNDFGRYKNLRGKERTIKALNARLKDIARQNNATFIDLTPALSDQATGKLRKDFTNDGLHLLGKGYKAWAEAISPMISE